MGREATKAIGNPWYEARVEAAKWDRRLLSREGAAELLGMSVSSVADAELSLTKCMPPDKAVQMADLYNAPHLLNYYCLHECPVGKDRPVSEEIVPIERVTVKLLKGMKLDRLDDIKDRLMDIAADGLVTEDEIDDLSEITGYLEEVAKSISELKIITEIAIRRSKKGCRTRKS